MTTLGDFFHFKPALCEVYFFHISARLLRVADRTRTHQIPKIEYHECRLPRLQYYQNAVRFSSGTLIAQT